MAKHKWYNEIMHFYAGGTVQYTRLRIEPQWFDWKEKYAPHWDNEQYQFRIKPETHKYQYLVDAVKSGKKVQFKSVETGEWRDWELLIKVENLKASIFTEYLAWRVKPDDIVSYLYLSQENGKWYLEGATKGYQSRMVKIVVDPDTRQVKDVVLLAETAP